METIRRVGLIFVAALALSLPTLARAEQAPSELCGGDKVEGKDPSADKSESSKQSPKSEEKSQDKTQDKSKQSDASKS